MSSPPRILLLIHLGLGDHLAMAPAVQHFAKQASVLYVPCKTRYRASVEDIYAATGCTNIQLLDMPAKNEIEELQQIDHYRETLGGDLKVLRTGHFSGTPYLLDPVFPRWFYTQLGLSYEDSVRAFRFVPHRTTMRDAVRLFGVPYIFVHEQSSTVSMRLAADLAKDRTRLVLTPDANIYARDDPYYAIAQLAVRTDATRFMDYAALLEGAAEIHCFDSSYFNLALLCDLSAVGACTVYSRGGLRYSTQRPWRFVAVPLP